MCQECTDRSFVEHYQTSNSSAIDMWIQSDSCVICFPLVFSVEVSLSEHCYTNRNTCDTAGCPIRGALIFLFG